MAHQRLQREFVHLMREPIPVASVKRNENNPFQWTAYMIGPPDSPYETGIIEVELLFNDQYPIKPPDIKFNHGIFHANIGRDGHLCCTLFNKWRSVDTVATVLLAINNLLSNPNRNSPLQGYGLSEEEYIDKAKKWTSDYGHILK